MSHSFESLVDTPGASIGSQVGSQKGSQPSPGKPVIPSKRRRVELPPIPEICERIRTTIPSTLYGIERLQYLAQTITKLDEQAIVRLQAVIKFFMRYMRTLGASDIDVGGPASQGGVWLRINGEKKVHRELGQYHVDISNILLLSLLTKNQLVDLFGSYSLDQSLELPDETNQETMLRYRMSMYFDNNHIALNLRAIANELRPIDSLGFHPSIQKGLMFDHVRDGLTLITGVTGSGKSTTMDAIVDANNVRVHGHMVIIAKPLEFIHQSKKCIVRHREVGKDVASFHQGVVQSLRQDPDIIVIGEMRDPSTISAALEVTDSGHKVFSTLHTSSAVESVARIVAEYAKEEQDRVRDRLADVLRCIISQKLLPKVGGGRILAKEVLWVTPGVRSAIKGNNLDEIYQMMWEGKAAGQHTLEQDLYRLMRQRLITQQTAIDFANNKKRLAQLLNMR